MIQGQPFIYGRAFQTATQDAMQLNEILISRAGVAGVPGSAFADGDVYDKPHALLHCARRRDSVRRVHQASKGAVGHSRLTRESVARSKRCYGNLNLCLNCRPCLLAGF